jgi:hypothetical protein
MQLQDKETLAMPQILRRFAPALAVMLAVTGLSACAYDDGYYRHSGYYNRYDDGYRAHPRYHHDDYGYEDNYGYGSYRVCDPDGDRCYRSGSPHWNYREYYRHRGYRWRDDD